LGILPLFPPKPPTNPLLRLLRPFTHTLIKLVDGLGRLLADLRAVLVNRALGIFPVLLELGVDLVGGVVGLGVEVVEFLARFGAGEFGLLLDLGFAAGEMGFYFG